MTTRPDDDSTSPLPRPLDEAAQLRPRPPVLSGATYRARTPVGTAFVTVNSDAEGNIREVFVTVGRAGSDIAADAEALGRLISLACRIPTAVPPRQVVEAVIDQLSGIGGSSSLGFGPHRVRSLADAVARVLAEHCAVPQPISPGDRPPPLVDDEPRSSSDSDESASARDVGAGDRVLGRRTGDFCPTCGQMNLVNEEGCRKCYGCGYSSC